MTRLGLPPMRSWLAVNGSNYLALEWYARTMYKLFTTSCWLALDSQ